IQSRQPSGWRAAERRRGWRCRGYGGGRGRGGSARPAASGDAGETAGQQRPLQLPGASAAAAQTRLLRWHRRVPSPRAQLSGFSVSSSGPDSPERPECAKLCSYLLDPLDLFGGCPSRDFDRLD
uniref:Uncharacterized protein n=1 Tax=Saimiri boliviensis boliviensis TaxID=39432 RepID=A0A2K6SC28_SAIBB